MEQKRQASELSQGLLANEAASGAHDVAAAAGTAASGSTGGEWSYADGDEAHDPNRPNAHHHLHLKECVQPEQHAHDAEAPAGPAEGAGSDEGGDGCAAMAWRVFEAVIWPMRLAFEYTCPPCAIWDEECNEEEGRPLDAQNPTEWAYPITFLVSFLWVSIFSFIISAIVERWCDLLHADVGFFGMAIVAVGAEIPDTIQSMTVSNRGYGAMAVGNCLGSQICNICLGLGVPWTISALLGHAVNVKKATNLKKTAFFQAGIVTFFFVSLLGVAWAQRKNKAELDVTRGRLYLVLYGCVLVALAIMTFA